MRFDISSVMIAVAAVAVVLAFPAPLHLKLLALLPTALAMPGVPRLIRRGNPRVIASLFCTWAILANVGFAVLSLTPDIYLGLVLKYLWVLAVLPVCAAVGTAWAILAGRAAGGRRGPARAALPLVVILNLLPMATVQTWWPLRVAFRLNRRELERLADRIATGQAASFPRWVGPYRLEDGSFEPASDGVALMTNASKGGPAGFVREEQDNPTVRRHLIIGSDLDIELSGGWSYRQED